VESDVIVNREELAWAAGFFDGEGTTGAYLHDGRLVIGMSISQVQLEPLMRFQRAVGGLGHVGGRANRSLNQWQTRKFEHVQAVIAFLWTFLSGPKREQARRALIAFSQRPHRTRRVDCDQSHGEWVDRGGTSGGYCRSCRRTQYHDNVVEVRAAARERYQRKRLTAARLPC
jgi:hypothetical protein